MADGDQLGNSAITFKNQKVDQHTIGLYGKFRVTRLDGRGLQGQDRADAEYYVIDLKYAKEAQEAVLAIVEALRDDFPTLAEDLDRVMSRLHGEDWEDATLDKQLARHGINPDLGEP